MTYLTKNGYVDTGKRMSSRCCPNCGSSKYVETVSRESCSACGLECNYWGSGANSVYESMMEHRAAEEDERRQSYQSFED